MTHAYARHSPAATYCIVRSSDSGGSVETFCFGRWPTSDTFDIHDSPEPHEVCGACADNAREAGRG